MNILVACEESQAVCIECRKLGHNAFSCDIEPCSGGHPEWHIQQDVLPLLNGNCEFDTVDGTHHKIDGKWDMIIAHPPCTYLTCCANRAYSLKHNTLEKVLAREREREKAVIFFMDFVNADCDKIAIENPVGYMNTHYRKPDMIVHPYYFVESKDDIESYHQKKTCFWLKGLQPLYRTTFFEKPEPKYICKGEKSKGKHIGWCEGMSGVSNRAKARSKTAPALAKAMAIQWAGKASEDT